VILVAMGIGAENEDLFVPLYDALLSAYGNDEVGLDMMLRRRIGKHLSFYTPPDGLDRRIYRLVARFMGDRDHTPEDLLRAAYEDRPRVHLVRELYRRRLGGTEGLPLDIDAPAQDPFEAQELGDLVFLDRRKLRASLKAVEAHGNRPVVVVKGAPGSGRSYAHELIRHIARRRQQQVVRVDMRQPAETGRIPSALVGAILAQMDVERRPREERVNQLLHETMGLFRRVQGIWWIVLHNFDGGVSEEVRGFLLGLANQIADLPGFRLALLGYDAEILRPHADRVRLVEDDPPQRDDVVAFFDCAFRRRGHVVPREVSERAADLVWAKLPTENPDRLRLLNELVSDALARLFPEETP
jgi:hypothetical protein